MIQDTLSAGAVIAILVSLIKGYLEIWLKPTDQAHDPVIRSLAIVLGVVGQVLYVASHGSLTAVNAWDAAQQGLLAGITAIVTFHVVTADWFAEQQAPAATTTTVTAGPVTTSSGAAVTTITTSGGEPT